MLPSGAVEIYTIIKQMKPPNVALHYWPCSRINTLQVCNYYFWNTHEYLIAADIDSQREADPSASFIGIHDYVSVYMANARVAVKQFC